MRTQLSQFCEHFDRVARPLLAPLGDTVAALARADAQIPGADLHGDLSELCHQLQTLVDKVQEQQAYVLIFGPLKSGKSTLMNAVAGAYVSEVSSLPAYPCLVFVSHGAQRKYVVRHYDGTDQTLNEPGGLRRHIRDAHGELAGVMRQTEDAGDQFEPREHFPAAIRRVDVQVPAPKLQESGAVLVDTPGLYTRMRFGYDRMTRDFRNAAACAIFVVRSDTLFLEQVFTEFNQLLELFSRIFLVVNIDTKKRDLGPDGRLLPSLEQRNPERIIEAFESLAMTAPLKRAEDEGRLRIYPVDLMSAASAVLQGDADNKLPPSYVRFRDELNNYLASADYLVAFLRDSLQRAVGLAGEAQKLGSADEVVQLRDEVGHTEDQREACRMELARIGRLLEQDWDPCFARFDADLADEVERVARDKGARLGRAMLASIDTWFLSGHGLEWLILNEWAPLVQEYRDLVHDVAVRRFEQSCLHAQAGLDLNTDCSTFLQAEDVDIAALRREALASLGPPEWPARSRVPMRADEVPIKKGLLDLVTFRSIDKVRQQLFGPSDRPNKRIEPRAKVARLGEAGKHFMRERVIQFRDNLQRTTVATALLRFDRDLRKATINALNELLAARQPQLRRDLARCEEHKKHLLLVLEPLTKLHAVATEVESKLHALSSQYARAGAESLLRPVAASGDGDVVLQPQPQQRTQKDGRQPSPRERQLD
ncbi:MAG: dynamin family protein [Planctomycetota bacterium]|jgi:energy-coupling factor transporter ATP-binding protein EcfA2